jgi:hypothetical protein
MQPSPPPALATVGAALAADIVGCLGGLVNDGPLDGGFWDKASTLGSSAKRLQTFAACVSNLYGRRGGTTAVPSEAESQRSSALGHCLLRAGAARSDHIINAQSQKRTPP